MTNTNNKITLAQVADFAGVSSSTVSRYLSGANPVAPDKAEAIERAIRELNYRPNLVARGLATGRTMTVGVLTQELLSSFFSETMHGVEDGLAAHNYEAVYASGHWESAREERHLNSMVGRGVDGVILIQPSIQKEVIEHFAQFKPIVVVGYQMDNARVPSLVFDQYQGAKLAMEHLLSLGHRRIAFIAGPQSRSDADERKRAYVDALASVGIGYDPALVESGGYVQAGGLEAMNKLLDKELAITAVFAANDDSAYGAILALHRRGLRVPEDVSVVGFDDVHHSAYLVPPLTTVRQPLRQLGLETANAMVELIGGAQPKPVLTHSLDLIVRESTRSIQK